MTNDIIGGIDLGFDILDYDPRSLPESLEDADYMWPGSIDGEINQDLE